jgi:hypothetical protein
MTADMPPRGGLFRTTQAALHQPASAAIARSLARLGPELASAVVVGAAPYRQRHVRNPSAAHCGTGSIDNGQQTSCWYSMFYNAVSPLITGRLFHILFKGHAAPIAMRHWQALGTNACAVNHRRTGLKVHFSKIS